MQRIFIVFLLLSINTYGQTIQLNEIVSSNASVIYDEDGDTPDWIELHNPSNQAVNLDGFGITDDPGDLSMWIFPSIVIEPNGFLVIFASDKDRKDLVTQWDAVINWGDSWSFLSLSEAKITRKPFGSITIDGKIHIDKSPGSSVIPKPSRFTA
jgi:hypothetical protein